MKVCGACGIRDPKIVYNEKTLHDLPGNHWLVVPPSAFNAKFKDTFKFPLMHRDANRDISFRHYSIQEFYNVVELKMDAVDLNPEITDPHAPQGTRAFHVIQEAIIRDSEDASKASIFMCRTCHSCKAFNTQPGPRIEAEQTDLDFVVKSGEDKDCSVEDSISQSVTYYSMDAPTNSIAKGHDYGRILHGILPAPSTLEKMILAEGRSYNTTIKIVANGNTTERKRLLGNTICFPQTYEPLKSSSFSAETIAAALTGINIVLVGAQGQRSRMEKAALNVDDLVLRPEVLSNHFHLKYRLHGGKPPPNAQEIVDVINKFDMPAHIHKFARSYEDTSLEPVISDIANVRSHAREERDVVSAVDGDDQQCVEELAPTLVPIGVMPHKDIGTFRTHA
jgi:hypothetical protein